MSKSESNRRCEELFADYLDGHELMDNAAHLRGSAWLNFPRVTNAHWFHDNVVLLGDSAHTAHFSIGSGTKLALEDAIDLAGPRPRGARSGAGPRRLSAPARDRGAEAAERRAQLDRVVRERAIATRRFPPMQFTYSLLTRSQRISHENLRAAGPRVHRGLRALVPGAAPDVEDTSRRTPPMFTAVPSSGARARQPRRGLAHVHVQRGRRVRRTTSTWCTWDRSRSEAPGSSSPR